MPTARSKALAARAGRSFIDPVKQTLPSERAKAQEEGLVTVWREESEYGERSGGQPHALVVLAKNGTQWRPALSLYEYVQQNVVEICAAKISGARFRSSRTCVGQEPSGAPIYEYGDGWEDAREVYAEPVGLKTSGGIDSLLRCITPSFAGFIVEQRRNEESAMRYLRVIARRINVPDDCLKHIEAFAGLLPARDAVPCRREQLPAFMQRLYELKMDEICRNNSHFDRLSLKSGHAGGAEVWTGSSGGRFSTSRWTLLPRKFVPQYRELPASMGIDMSGYAGHGIPEDCLDECESEAPGCKTFLYGEYSEDGQYYVNCYTKTFPWFEERPWDFYLQPVNAWPAGTSIEDAASDSDAKSDSESESDSDSDSDPYEGLDLDSESGQARAQEISRARDERRWKRKEALRRKKKRAMKRSRKNAEDILGFGYY
jgi:hypothetical protein